MNEIERKRGKINIVCIFLNHDIYIKSTGKILKKEIDMYTHMYIHLFLFSFILSLQHSLTNFA